MKHIHVKLKRILHISIFILTTIETKKESFDTSSALFKYYYTILLKEGK